MPTTIADCNTDQRYTYPHLHDRTLASETHLHAEELGRDVLELPVQLRVAELGARGAHGEAEATRGVRHVGMRAAALALREAEVVVGAQVDAAPLRTCEPATVTKWTHPLKTAGRN